MSITVNKQKLAEAQARADARYSPEDKARFAQEAQVRDAETKRWMDAGSPGGIAIDSLPGFGFGPNARLPRDPAKEAAYDQQWQQQFPQSGGGRDSFGGQGPLLNQPGGGGMGVGQPPVPDPSGVPQGSAGIPFQGGQPFEQNNLTSAMSGRGPAFEAWANQFLQRNKKKPLNQGPNINNVGVRQ